MATFSYRKVFKQSSLLLRDSEVQRIIYDERPFFLWWPFMQTELVFDLDPEFDHTANHIEISWWRTRKPESIMIEANKGIYTWHDHIYIIDSDGFNRFCMHTFCIPVLSLTLKTHHDDTTNRKRLVEFLFSLDTTSFCSIIFWNINVYFSSPRSYLWPARRNGDFFKSKESATSTFGEQKTRVFRECALV